MRIDKFLKVSRVIKRRTVAKEAADGGRISINERPAKAGTEIKVGDIVDIRFGSNSLKFEVISVQEHVKKEDADKMYRILSE